MEVKAAALHAVALVLGPPTTESPTTGDEVMGNTPAEEERETKSLLYRTLFERLGVCNRKSAGALVVELARQPVPEVSCLQLDVPPRLALLLLHSRLWAASFTRLRLRTRVDDKLLEV